MLIYANERIYAYLSINTRFSGYIAYIDGYKLTDVYAHAQQ